jgi:hypothetical protein
MGLFLNQSNINNHGKEKVRIRHLGKASKNEDRRDHTGSKFLRKRREVQRMA